MPNWQEAIVDSLRAKEAVSGIANSGGVTWTSGNGSPEGIVVAVVGSLYTRLDGGGNTTLYTKETGSGATGWSAK